MSNTEQNHSHSSPLKKEYFTADFSKILQYELQQVETRRKAVLETTHDPSDAASHQCEGDLKGLTDLEKARFHAHHHDLFGLSFSGGGIRSATFNLGILQALANLKILTRIDYLSTVSGGGYIGGWLAAWIQRETQTAVTCDSQNASVPRECSFSQASGGDSIASATTQSASAPSSSSYSHSGIVTEMEAGKIGVENVQNQLSPSRISQAEACRVFGRTKQREVVCDEEPEPIRHLREYSRYLAPRPGPFSLDSWALMAIYIRNLVMNLLVILPIAVLLIVLARLITIPFQHPWVSKFWKIPEEVAVILATFPLLFAYFFVGKSLASVRENQRRDGGDLPVIISPSGGLNRVWVLFPILGAGWLSLYFFGQGFPNDVTKSRISHDVKYSWLWYVCAAGFITLSVIGYMWYQFRVKIFKTRRLRARSSSSGFGKRILYFFILAVASAGLFFLLHFARDGEFAGPLVRSAIIYAIIGLVGSGLLRIREMANGHFEFDAGIWLTLAAMLFGIVFGLLLWVVIWFFNFRESHWHDPIAVVAFGPPLFLVAIVLASYIEVAFGGDFIQEPEREWRSRFGGFLIASAALWAVLATAIFYVPCLFLDGSIWTWLGWGVSAIGTYLSGRAPSGKKVGIGGVSLQLVANIAPPLLLIGFLGGLSLVVGYFLNGSEWPKPDAPLSPLVQHRFEVTIPASEPGKNNVIVGKITEPCSPDDRAKICEADDGKPHGDRRPPFLKSVDLDKNRPCVLWLTLDICVFAAMIFLKVIQVNTFSLHSLYRNRLVRCYLGASQNRKEWPQRWGQNPLAPSWGLHPGGPTGAPTGVLPPPRIENEFTKFDNWDDVPLTELRISDQPISKRGYYGPYPLFNTTLNLVAGSTLAEQDRKGESFVLTPDYCGSQRTGYAVLGVKDSDSLSIWSNLTIGRAVATSGAAVDPNMPNYQSAPLTFLLTILNLRVGCWIENPNPEPEEHKANDCSTEPKIWPKRDAATPWQADSPKSARLLLSELRGETRANGPYVHLSDGGHFENTGAYELIRRRCRFIVVIDAAEDPNDASENLASLIRLARIDFGIRIEVDTTPLHKDKDGMSRAHVAVGVIRYDDVDTMGVNGTLLFIRSSLTGDEPADLKNYAINNPPFPHQSTANQFFDESEFESYRMLGFHVGTSVFGRAVEESKVKQKHNHPSRYNRLLFAELRQEWTQVTTGQYEEYTEALDPWEQWDQTMRTDPNLTNLNVNFYPELESLPASSLSPPDSAWSSPNMQARISEMRAVSQLVGMMEAAWMKMELATTFASPLQRGWMNCFRRWTASSKFQEYWPMFRPQYSWGFTRFCERVLCVAPVSVCCVRWDENIPEKEKILERLDREFFGEWATVLTQTSRSYVGWERDHLRSIVHGEDYTNSPLSRRPMVWLLTYGKPGEQGVNTNAKWVEGSDSQPPSFPIGIVAVRHWPYENGGAKYSSGTAKYYELLFWVRGGYRTAEVGQESLPKLIKLIREELTAEFGPADGAGRYLMTRFPKVGGKAVDSTQRAMWSMFFNDNDFYSYQLETKIAESEVRLRMLL